MVAATYYYASPRKIMLVAYILLAYGKDLHSKHHAVGRDACYGIIVSYDYFTSDPVIVYVFSPRTIYICPLRRIFLLWVFAFSSNVSTFVVSSSSSIS